MTVIVYTKPNCVQCGASTRKMEELGVEYEPRPLAEHPEGLEVAREHGISSAPVIVADGQVWGGYKPEEIERYARSLVPA